MSVATSPSLTSSHRFTVEQYNRMIEAGVLTKQDRVELLNGEIVDMTPMGDPHSGTVRKLRVHFSPLDRGRAVIGSQEPVNLDGWSRPEPDLWLAAYRRDQYSKSAPNPVELLLVAEVADSSLGKDQNLKVPLYAQAGVAEVWIVDLRGKSLTVYRGPADGEYMTIQKFKAGAKIAPIAFPDLPLDLGELFSD